MIKLTILIGLFCLFVGQLRLFAEPISISGIFPHLVVFNDEGKCGTGAVVPWADRLWVITDGPHLPFGSSGKLYEITPGIEQIIRPEMGDHSCKVTALFRYE